MSISKLEIWKEHIQHCKSSGLSVVQYCRDHHLSKGQYYYWHKIINAPVSPSKVAPVFAELTVENNEPTYNGIKINYKEVEIALSSKNDISLAVEFIHVLQSRC